MKKQLLLILTAFLILVMSISVNASHYDSDSGTRWNSICYASFGVYNSNAQAATRIERGNGHPTNLRVELWARVYDEDTQPGCSDSKYAMYDFSSPSTYANATINAHTGYTSQTVNSIHSIENTTDSHDIWYKTFSYDD